MLCTGMSLSLPPRPGYSTFHNSPIIAYQQTAGCINHATFLSLYILIRCRPTLNWTKWCPLPRELQKAHSLHSLDTVYIDIRHQLSLLLLYEARTTYSVWHMFKCFIATDLCYMFLHGHIIEVISKTITCQQKFPHLKMWVLQTYMVKSKTHGSRDGRVI